VNELDAAISACSGDWSGTLAFGVMTEASVSIVSVTGSV
jgi:hypothetical protein